MFLSAQPNDFGPMIQFGLGFRTANSGPRIPSRSSIITNGDQRTASGGYGMLGDMTGQTLSIGATAESRIYFANFSKAIRFKGAFDRWGNQHFKGTGNDKCQVECLSGTVGFMIYPDRAKYANLHFCFELGAAQWGIDSTFPSRAKQTFTRPMIALLTGGESRHWYLQLGVECSFIGDELKIYKIEGRPNNYHTLGTFVIATGWKI
jgi:hypothetical protein